MYSYPTGESLDGLITHILVPIMGFGLVYSVHKYGGCWRYYTLHMVDRYSNLVDTTLLHHDFALDI